MSVLQADVDVAAACGTLLARFADLSETDASSDAGVTRLGYTPLERAAHDVFAEWMRDRGLVVATDAAGTTIAELAGTDPTLPALGTGSHLDSVPNGGRFDGVAGVVAAMIVADRLAAGASLRHPVRFVAFACEEGARFGQACNGSRIAAGATDAEALAARVDADGVSVVDAMHEVGLDPSSLAEARWPSDDWLAFVELHIEQGSVLASAGVPIGVVDVVSGSTRIELHLTGRASHSGGTPMHARRDALAAASEIVLLAEAIACDARHFGTRITVGRLDVSPNSITTIPGDVRLAIDVRDVDGDRQRTTAVELAERAGRAAEARRVGCEAHVLGDASPTHLSARVGAAIARAAGAVGAEHRVLASGASHDAQQIQRICPSGILFVPSLHDGVSHAPDELTDLDDLALGIHVLEATLRELDSAAGRTA